MEPTSASKPRLLFITQKIHAHDDDLAFTILWIQEFIRAGFEVVVICLEKRDFNGSFPVHSLGKEDGGKVIMGPEVPGNRMDSEIDTSKTKLLGWKPSHELEEYIHAAVQ